MAPAPVSVKPMSVNFNMFKSPVKSINYMLKDKDKMLRANLLNRYSALC